jgi:hypothetical protein
VRVPRLARKFGHFMWVNFEESGAIMAGQTIEIDQSQTGEKFRRSPVITETSETHTETTVSARSVGRKHN